MTELQNIKIELRKVKKKLIRGDQRELARRLGEHPNKISDGFDGFLSDTEFLKSLAAESQKLIAEHNEAQVLK